MKVTLAAILAAKKKPPQCRLGPQIAGLSPSERRDYARAMADLSIPLPAIQRVLEARGLKVNQTTLHHHRHRQCSTCFGTGGR